MRPELKDKIAFAGSDTGVTVIGAMLKFQGEEYVKKLKSQNPAIHNVSGRALLDMVISGEVGVSPTTFRNHVEVSLKAGAPIEWIPMDVVPSNSGSTAISAKAPHPHAALLLADFILGAGGQKVLEEYEYGNPTKDYGFKRWYPEQGLSAEQIDKLEERWRSHSARSDQAIFLTLLYLQHLQTGALLAALWFLFVAMDIRVSNPTYLARSL